MLDWHLMHSTLFSLVCGDIEEFAILHERETFYGFYLDCDSYYGDVFPGLNTPEHLRERAEAYKYNLRSIAGPAVPSNPYSTWTLAQIEDELRWSPGDWGYLQINRWTMWRTDWDPIRMIIQNERSGNVSFCEQFMGVICRVLIQIEESGVLDRLQRSPDFATMCADHDERLEDSCRRLARIRVP